MTEDFWDDILALIEEGNLLPIVGQGVTTFGAGDELLAPWLAKRLAERLKVQETELPPDPSLNDVFSRYLMNGRRRDDAYMRLFRILRDEKPSPGTTLRRLASVTGIPLFISTTSDSLLADALNAVRHGGREATKVCGYSPSAAAKDLPAAMSELRGSNVFHILGQASQQVGEFVAWDEDLLEFILQLNSHLIPGVMPHLSRDLSDSNVRILAIGLNFSDWLLRFFLRVARQRRLTSTEQGLTYLAEGAQEALPRSLVMFFGPLAQRMEVISMDPRQFVKELADRWQQCHPDAEAPPPTIAPSISDEMPRGAIFISYVREDEPAVIELVGRLQAQGCNVWYDREQLKSGMNFDYRIKDYVLSRCSIFVSVLSRTTESQGEAYFHRERNWAADRAQNFSDRDRDRFYHPLIVDDLDPGAVEREPGLFGNVNRIQIVGGKADQAFCQRLFDLHNEMQKAAT